MMKKTKNTLKKGYVSNRDEAKKGTSQNDDSEIKKGYSTKYQALDVKTKADSATKANLADPYEQTKRQKPKKVERPLNKKELKEKYAKAKAKKTAK